MWEIQAYEVAVRVPRPIGEREAIELHLRVAQPDLDAVLRSLASSGVESFHVRRLPRLGDELAGQVAMVAGEAKK